jgi:excinuclease ABC subunit B
MRSAIDETDRRRVKQTAFNLAHGIVPHSIVKEVREMIDGVFHPEVPARGERGAATGPDYETMNEKELAREIKKLEKQMFDFARNLEFEKAARARDQLARLRALVFGAVGHAEADQLAPGAAPGVASRANVPDGTAARRAA